MSKTRIIEAVRKLDLESIKKLLEDNPSLLSVTDRKGRNLLHLACSAQCKELNVPESVSARVVTFILNRRLDVESPLVTSDGCDTVNAVWFAEACANREFHIKQYGQKLTTDASASRSIILNCAKFSGQS